MGYANIIQLFGGLGIFIYGMKLMSESLEKSAGNNLKNLLSSMTSNRFFGVLTGFLITSIIQSSSATTVMVVSFVNAGLLNLTQAIGIVMGANIGTTLTAWIVNLTNIKVNMTMVAYFVVAVGMVFVFLRSLRIKNWGYILIGFAFLFIGLNLLKKSVPSADAFTNNYFYNFLSGFPADKYWSYIVFILIGTLLTVVLQSSSATMAVTITLVNQGYINIIHAAAMVLGENIGTTITANLASLAGNKLSKKAALSHTIFNFFGVFWMMMPFVFPNFLAMCGKLSGFAPVIFEHTEGIQLAIFHSLFNITNTTLFIWFVPQIEKLVNYIYGEDTGKQKLRLSNIKYGLINTPDIAVLEAQNEIINMANLSHKMFGKTCDLLEGSKIEKTHDKIKNLEKEIDNYENEIYSFLVDLLREDTSVATTDKINILMDEIRNLEWIGDSCENIADLVLKAYLNNYELIPIKEEHLKRIQTNVEAFFKLYIENIKDLDNLELYNKGIKFEKDIDSIYKKMKKKSISNMKSMKKNIKKNVASGLIFMDIIKGLEHVGDALRNIIYSYNEKNI